MVKVITECLNTYSSNNSQDIFGGIARIVKIVKVFGGRMTSFGSYGTGKKTQVFQFGVADLCIVPDRMNDVMRNTAYLICNKTVCCYTVFTVVFY